LAVLVRQAGAPASYWAALQSAGNQLWHSMGVATGTATLATGLAFVGAVCLRRWSWPCQQMCCVGVTLPFVLPGTILGLGAIKLWNHPGFAGLVYGSAGILILVCAGKLLALAYLPTIALLSKCPTDQEDAALVHGVSWWRTALAITGRRCAPGVAGIWLAVFVFALTELDASILVCPPGFSTAGVRLFSLLHYGVNSLVAALALLLVAATVLAVLAGTGLWRRFAGGAAHG